jgi:hypothetical protein
VLAAPYAAAWISDYQPHLHGRRLEFTAANVSPAISMAGTVPLGARHRILAVLCDRVGPVPGVSWSVGNQVDLRPVIESRKVAAAAVDDAVSAARWIRDGRRGVEHLA